MQKKDGDQLKEEVQSGGRNKRGKSKYYCGSAK